MRPSWGWRSERVVTRSQGLRASGCPCTPKASGKHGRYREQAGRRQGGTVALGPGRLVRGRAGQTGRSLQRGGRTRGCLPGPTGTRSTGHLPHRAEPLTQAQRPSLSSGGFDGSTACKATHGLLTSSPSKSDPLPSREPCNPGSWWVHLAPCELLCVPCRTGLPKTHVTTQNRQRGI